MTYILTQIYFLIPEIFKAKVSIHFFSTKNHLLNLCSGVVNSQSLFCNQSWCEMFVLKLIGIQYIYYVYIKYLKYPYLTLVF